MMRRPIFDLGILLLICITGCSKGDRSPGVELASDRIDLGVLEPGENPILIKFSNVGQAPLHVEKVRSTCSCTRADCPPVVAAGGMGEIRGKVNVQGGPGGAELSLVTNAPGDPKVIHIKWFGKSTPTLLPDSLDVRMKTGEAAMRPIELSYAAGDPPGPIEFFGVSGLPAGAKVELVSDDPKAITSTPGLWASPTVAPSPFVGKARLRLVLPSTSTPGFDASNGLVKVGLAGKKFDLPLRLVIRVDEGLRISPERLIFSASGLDSLQKIRRKAIATSDVDADHFQVVEKPSFLDVALSKADEDHSTTQLEARVISPPPDDGADRRIVLENSSGKRVSVSILIGVGR